MQVFGLPGHVIRSGRRASRLLDAKTPTIEAERRRDAVARWRGAMRAGLTAAAAADAVGVPRATLYRWEKEPAPKSRRPHRVRQRNWSPALRTEVERLRLDFPMWGKDKLGPLLRKAGFSVSNATVGRILKSLVERGRVTPVPDLIARVGRRTDPKTRPHAIRKPKHVRFEKPGDVVQIDTLTLNLAPGRTLKHFDSYDCLRQMDRRQALRTSNRPKRRRLPRQGHRRNALARQGHPDRRHSWPSSKTPAKTGKSRSMSCRQGRRSSTEPSSAATAHGATNSTQPSTCQTRSTRSPTTSTPSNTSTTITDPTELSTA